MTRSLALLAGALAAGCTQQLNVGGPCKDFNTGEEPCRQQLYFPTGVAADVENDLLYVASGNADLRYSGGAVHAIDLRHVECVIAYAREGQLPPALDCSRSL